MFIVTYLSKDKHRFVFETDSKTEKIALENSQAKLKELDYEQYQYEFISIVEK